MHVNRKYLDEIEQILEGVTDEFGIEPVVRLHWHYPRSYAGLFNYVYTGTANPIGCGCLTQVHDGSYFAADFDGHIDLALSRQIRDDTRLHGSVSSLVEDLEGKTREEQRAVLMPYAEWQTKLGQMRRDNASRSKVS